ncbi:MAG: hypothetical protein WC209_14100 [Ignavibacteriaceae bacterium]|jgi:hypothetical protein
MSGHKKILAKVLSGVADANISFDDLCGLLHFLKFNSRIKGSHHIFYKENVEEILNLQARGSEAKPYQVKQVRDLILKYRLGENLK